MKRCPRCKNYKSLTDFRKSTKAKDGHQGWCKYCQDRNYKSYREKNAKRISARTKDYRYKKDYGISLSEFERLAKKQKFKCAICKRKQKKKSDLFVDHCHKTIKVRGLLCAKCNFGLGQFEDNILLLRIAIKYLRGDLV